MQNGSGVAVGYCGIEELRTLPVSCVSSDIYVFESNFTFSFRRAKRCFLTLHFTRSPTSLSNTSFEPAYLGYRIVERNSPASIRVMNTFTSS